jgi:hypothetical protein
MSKMKGMLGLIAGAGLIGGSIYSLAKKKADSDAVYLEDCDCEEEEFEVEDVDDSEE